MNMDARGLQTRSAEIAAVPSYRHGGWRAARPHSAVIMGRKPFARAAAIASVTLAMLATAPARGEPDRVPPVADDAAPPAVASIFAAIRAGGSNPLSMHRAVANAPELFVAYVNMARALRQDDHVSRPLRELAILRTLQIEEGTYEIEQHTRMARSCGLSEAQIGAMKDWRGSTLFDPEQRAVLGWVDAMAKPEGPDAVAFAAMAQRFDPHAIVELTLAAGFYAMSARTTKALAVKPEAPAQPAGGGYGAC